MSDPVPGTGHKSPAARRTKAKNGGGASASSHILHHHYADEGETGRLIRRLVRRRETRLWKKEVER